MAGVLEGEGFWLPSDFFSDGDFLACQDSFCTTEDVTESKSELCFPADFPYDESFLCKLADFGSWPSQRAGGTTRGTANAVTYARTTPFPGQYVDIEELIHRTAVQVAKMKLNAGDWTATPPAKHKDFFSPCSVNKRFPSGRGNFRTPLFSPAQNQRFGVPYPKQQLAPHALGSNSWKIDQSPSRLTTIPARRSCAGTGVFLPRGYANINNSNNDRPLFPGFRQKPVSSPAFFGRTGYPTAQPKNANNMMIINGGLPHSEPKHSGFIPDHDSIMALRSAILLRHSMANKGSFASGREAYYP